jgi:hypothetical protein
MELLQRRDAGAAETAGSLMRSRTSVDILMETMQCGLSELVNRSADCTALGLILGSGG